MSRWKEISVTCTIAIFALVASYCMNSEFLDEFMETRSLLLMGTMLSIYILTTVSILKNLTSIEEKHNEKIFDNTRAELKINTYLIFGLFALHFLMLSVTPSGCEHRELAAIILAIKVFTFSFYIYILYQLTISLFLLHKESR